MMHRNGSMMAGSGSSGSEEDSRNSSHSSEGERLRRLFNSCDADGDGFLDGDDLTFMCRMLNMGESVGEVRQQLGLTEDSKISFSDFLRCRSQVMNESDVTAQRPPMPLSGGETDTGIDSDTSGIVGGSQNNVTSWPTLSSDSLALSSTKPESLDYDSGTRDLSPEPVTFAQLMDTHDPKSIAKLRQAGAHSVLDIANRLHAAALTSLKGEIVELKGHVHRLTSERNIMLDHRDQANEGKLGVSDFEERLEQQTARYEERIIELHSVIAELRKKVERHQISVIREEEEYDESDQGGSIRSNDGESVNGKDENNEICQEFSRVVSEIETVMAAKSTAQLTIDKQEIGVDVQDSNTHQVEPPKSPCPPALPPRATRPCTLPHGNSADFNGGAELAALQADNEELRQQASRLEVELGEMAERMERVCEEKESLGKKLFELQKSVQSASSPSHSRVATPTKSRGTPPPMAENYPVAKMAELKKLRTCASDMQGILGSEVAMLGVESTSMAEHLVQSVQDSSNIAELMGGAKGHNQGTLREFEVELERRQARIDHLKAQNDVLQATLDESKSQAERLSVLIGKYESNNTALQLTSAFADHCLEAQDVLTALLDTELGVLLANCRAAGLGGLAGSEFEDDQEVTAILQRAHHARRRAESVARHLLSRSDRGSSGSHSSSSHPWDDVSTNSHTASTSSTSSSSELDFAKADELRLRECIQQLKTERSSVRTTVMELENVHVDCVEPRRKGEAQRLDLENAVLVQELMAVKEEKAELKARSYLLEKEKRALELRLSGKETQEAAYRVQIEHLQGELEEQQHSVPYPHYGVISGSATRTSPDPRHIAELASRDKLDLAHDLAVSLERERVHKSRVNELMSTLEKISRNSESRHKQSAEFVNDLKRANSALITAFDKAKKKYQGRLKKLEGQVKGVKEKYEADTTSLRQRISLLENRGPRLPPETSL